jgi:hypothetical protein
VVLHPLAESDVFVLPSITATVSDMEGVPVASLMSDGKRRLLFINTQLTGMASRAD